MSIRVKEYKFFRSLSVKVNDNWPVRKAEQLWRQMRAHKIAEIEATDACKWLRAAGFPQYAQMYEDMQFPVDVAAAEQDHPQLEPSVLLSLFRRLHALNRCARIHQQKSSHVKDEEDEQCALSDNWTFEAGTRRWSRVSQNILLPLDDEEQKKDAEKCPQEKVAKERLPESPKEKLRKAASTKFRWRRDGVTENRTDLIDSLSKQLHNLQKNEAMPVSVSVTSSSKKRKSRSLDKADTATNSPSYLCDNKAFWQYDRIEEGVAVTNDFQIAYKGENTTFSSMTCIQLQVLRKLALLKLTAHMEKYCPTHRTGWNWDLPKYIRSIKGLGYREKTVFGVPITIILQRTGSPIPKGVEGALHWLAENAVDLVGLFRKPGVRSRIQALKVLVDNYGDNLNFADHQAYDIADMVKQFFRELPDVLLTNKLSETFILIFQHIPPFLRRESVLCALLLMPNEHCEVLQVLLHFLNGISQHSELNQMNKSNLALCFAPTLFHHTQSATGRQLLGSPQQNELAYNKAAQECLLFFLKNFETTFKIPKEFIEQCKSTEMKEYIPISFSQLNSEYGGDLGAYLHDCQVILQKEARDKSRSWTLIPSHYPFVEISYKKPTDGHPLRLWKICAEINATPSEILTRILRERHIWDEELQSTRLIVQIDQNTEIFQCVRRNVYPLALEDYCMVRIWKTDLPKGVCLLIEKSVEHPDALSIPNSTRGIVLTSRYFLEPCSISNKSKLMHITRVDTRGRLPEWNHKNFGHLAALHIANIVKSFQQATNQDHQEAKTQQT